MLAITAPQLEVLARYTKTKGLESIVLENSAYDAGALLVTAWGLDGKPIFTRTITPQGNEAFL